VSLGDGVRLAVGTLTVLPVPPPRTVGRDEARTAMLLAPVVGLLVVGAPAAAALVGLDAVDTDPLLAAALAVGLTALLTRALHLDGLADVGDGLASRRPAAGALEVMKRPDIGALGAVLLLLVVLVQVAALAALQRADVGWAAVLVAVVAGRVAIVLGCRRGVRAARRDGLGAAVAGSVPVPAAVAVVGAHLGVSTALLAAVGVVDPVDGWLVPALGLCPALALLEHCRRRFGGVTGDVLGACCEAATLATLVAAALLLR
jgi:adenosylcobinamide-GDP ribazoletransferase